MKQPKKPTLAQKKIMRKEGLDWKDWNVAQEDNLSITVVEKKTGKRKCLLK